MALNNCTILGRLTRDPELKKTGSDVSYARFTVACDRDYQKEGQEKKTDFIDCLAWRGTADFIAKWFKKGDMIGVAGRLQIDNYETEAGEKRKAAQIVVEKASFAGSKSTASSADNAQDGFKPVTDDDIPF